MKKYKIVCYWPSEKWAVLEQVELNGKQIWRGRYICKAQKEEGYKEAKKWLKENDK